MNRTTAINTCRLNAAHEARVALELSQTLRTIKSRQQILKPGPKAQLKLDVLVELQRQAGKQCSMWAQTANAL